jgi:hypothetical protein
MRETNCPLGSGIHCGGIVIGGNSLGHPSGRVYRFKGFFATRSGAQREEAWFP